MPSFNFINKETSKEWTEFFSTNSAKEEFLSKNPHIKQTLSLVAIGDPYALGRKKTDSVFNERLKKIKKGSGRGDTINTGNLITI